MNGCRRISRALPFIPTIQFLQRTLTHSVSRPSVLRTNISDTIDGYSPAPQENSRPKPEDVELLRARRHSVHSTRADVQSHSADIDCYCPSRTFSRPRIRS